HTLSACDLSEFQLTQLARSIVHSCVYRLLFHLILLLFPDCLLASIWHLVFFKVPPSVKYGAVFLHPCTVAFLQCPTPKLITKQSISGRPSSLIVFVLCGSAAM